MTVAFGSNGSLTFDISSLTPYETKLAADQLVALSKKQQSD